MVAVFFSHFSFADLSSMEAAVATVTAADEHYDLYGQLATAHNTTNLQQLPQPNKRLQKLKKLKIREIQSLALEGGDTGRGYCSCDEQWTGSTTSSSPTSPTNSASPLPMMADSSSKTSIPTSSFAAGTGPGAAVASPLSQTQTKSCSSISSVLPSNNVSAEIYEKTSETGSGITNEAAGGSGYDTKNKQQPLYHGSTASAAMTTVASLLKHHHHHHHHPHAAHPAVASLSTDYASKSLITAVDNINETNFVVSSSSSSMSISTSATMANTTTGSSGKMKTITLRRNPIGTTAARLKQQHHVRFSDEKNFSD